MAAGFILTTITSRSSAQPSPTEKPLSPQILKILCERSPLNSRCAQSGSLGASPSAPVTSSGGGTLPPAQEVPQGEIMPAAPLPEPTAPAGGGTLPPVPSPSTTPAAPPEVPASGQPSSEVPASGGTVVEAIASNPKLKTLSAAIKESGLEETLSGQGPFTLFAPTDEAFAALPPEAVQELLNPENKARLAQLLTYHVVSGKVESSAIKAGQTQTVQGQPITLKVEGSQVTVNDAKVTQADIPASNGVIHLIDKVILPQDKAP